MIKSNKTPPKIQTNKNPKQEQLKNPKQTGGEKSTKSQKTVMDLLEMLSNDNGIFQ